MHGVCHHAVYLCDTLSAAETHAVELQRLGTQLVTLSLGHWTSALTGDEYSSTVEFPPYRVLVDLSEWRKLSRGPDRMIDLRWQRTRRYIAPIPHSAYFQPLPAGWADQMMGYE